MSDIPFHDGTIPYLGYQTWYRVYGDRRGARQAAAAGAPRRPRRLPRLPRIAQGDRARPAGGWSSTTRSAAGSRASRESRPELWTVKTFTDEVDAVRAALGLERIHLLGQSWGGMLAMEYMLTQPQGVASVTIASSPASMVQWVEEANRLRELLPPEVQATLLRHEAAGTTD